MDIILVREAKRKFLGARRAGAKGGMGRAKVGNGSI